MNKKLKKVILAFMFAMLCITVAPSVLPDNTGMERVEAATVKLSAKKVTLIKGQTKKLKVKGTSKKVKWSSSKKSVAKVNSKGKVTAVKKGTAKITAKVGGKKYTCKITVESPKISKTSVTLTVGDTKKLKVSGTSQTIKWSSNKKSVATVSSSGKVKAKKSGTATITAKVGGEKYKCKVTVNKAGLISASSTSVSMKDTGSKKVKITLTGASSRDASVSFSIGDSDIVSCSWGKWSGDTVSLTITGENAGSTSIKIKNTISSKTCTIKVVVKSSVTISMPSTPVTLNDYSSSGAVRRTFEVTDAYYTVEKSGSEYYYKIYIDGTKLYDSSGDNVSSNCYVAYKLYNNSDGTVVASGTIVTPALETGETCNGAWTNGFLDAGSYKLVLLDRS